MHLRNGFILLHNALLTSLYANADLQQRFSLVWHQTAPDGETPAPEDWSVLSTHSLPFLQVHSDQEW